MPLSVSLDASLLHRDPGAPDEICASPGGRSRSDCGVRNLLRRRHRVARRYLVEALPRTPTASRYRSSQATSSGSGRRSRLRRLAPRTMRLVCRSRLPASAMLMIGRLGALTGLEQASLSRHTRRRAPAALRARCRQVPLVCHCVPLVDDSDLGRSDQPSSGSQSARVSENRRQPARLQWHARFAAGNRHRPALSDAFGPARMQRRESVDCGDGHGVAGRRTCGSTTFTRRVALVLLAIGISYLANGFRIALVGWLAVNGLGDGDINGTGLVHLLQGLGVSALGYLAIGGCFALLSRSKPAASRRTDDGAPAVSSAGPSPLTTRRVWLDIAILLVMLGAGALSIVGTAARRPSQRGPGRAGQPNRRLDRWKSARRRWRSGSRVLMMIW